MLFNFGKTIAEIDVDRTREYYSNHGYINDCTCMGCKNYRKYTQECSPEISEYFRSFGIDNMNFIAEIIPFDMSRSEYIKRGGLHYSGFYHVVGKILTPHDFEPNDNSIKITDNFEISICDKPDLLSENFPKPALQIDIYAFIPWIVPDENIYLC